eukprot:47320-Prymnesium_polylepis.1
MQPCRVSKVGGFRPGSGWVAERRAKALSLSLSGSTLEMCSCPPCAEMCRLRAKKSPVLLREPVGASRSA